MTKNTFRQYRVLGKGGFGEVSERPRLWKFPDSVTVFVPSGGTYSALRPLVERGGWGVGPGGATKVRHEAVPQGPWDRGPLGTSLSQGLSLKRRNGCS